MTTLTNPTNGYKVEIDPVSSRIFVLLFGMFYLLAKGLVAHAALYFIASIVLSAAGFPIWVVSVCLVVPYMFFIPNLLEKHYLEKGYTHG